MKRLMLVCLLTLWVSATFAQNNVYWSMRVKVKMDKKLEWEKKVPVFMKTHYPQFKFRVWEVMTGANTGSYVIVLGPMAYKDMDVPPAFPKGEALAKTEGQALDAISESVEVVHSRKVEAISTMKADRKLKYIQVSNVDITPGVWPDVQAQLAKNKDARVKGGSAMDIDIFRPANSGLANSYIAVRYFEKMEDLDLDEKFGDMYDKAFGNNQFYKDSNNYYSLVQATRQELRALRPDLSTN